MVKAWYMDDDNNDQRAEHHRNPPQFISLEDLHKKTGVEYFEAAHLDSEGQTEEQRELNVDTYETDGVLDKIKQERGYTYEDKMEASKATLPNYEEKLVAFYTEHLHTDEEIRFVLDGSGYFDVRDRDDQWIRIQVTPGDMLVLPSGIYHRFTLDFNNYIKVKRFFIGEPVWAAHNRPSDDMDARKTYIEKLNKGFVAAY